MSYRSWSYDHDDRWLITWTERDLPGFIPSYTANGALGTRFGGLVLEWEPESTPPFSRNIRGNSIVNPNALFSLSKHVYDDGSQLLLPAWNQINLMIDGVRFTPHAGRHRVKGALDLRDGFVRIEDHWQPSVGGPEVCIEVELLIPRGTPSGGMFRIRISGARQAQIAVGLSTKGLESSYQRTGIDHFSNGIGVDYQTRIQNRNVTQALSWAVDGWEGGTLRSDETCVAVDLSLSQESAAGGATLTVFHSLLGENEAKATSAYREIQIMKALGFDACREQNRAMWRSLWDRGLRFEHAREDWEDLVLAQQFYLLASMGSMGGMPLGCLGLSRPEWRGAQLWDADLWQSRGMLLLWPEFSKSIFDFRRRTLDVAKRRAQDSGHRGAWFPWMATDEGNEGTLHGYIHELHVNCWIALNAWELYQVTQDIDWLRRDGFSVIQAVADFLASRCTFDSDGSCHLRNVLPPDENVHESPDGPQLVNDSVSTNRSVVEVMRAAIASAQLLGVTASPVWSEVRDRMFILPPDSAGVIPEYEGYQGQTIKQADTILLFYPLGSQYPKSTVLATLYYYRQRTLVRGGPLMTGQIEACILMKYDDRDKALQDLFDRYQRYVRGPLLIPFETIDNENSMMLTGIGGLLQALIFGYFGATLTDARAIPRIGAGSVDRGLVNSFQLSDRST